MHEARSTVYDGQAKPAAIFRPAPCLIGPVEGFQKTPKRLFRNSRPVIRQIEYGSAFFLPDGHKYFDLLFCLVLQTVRHKVFHNAFQE